MHTSLCEEFAVFGCLQGVHYRVAFNVPKSPLAPQQAFAPYRLVPGRGRGSMQQNLKNKELTRTCHVPTAITLGTQVGCLVSLIGVCLARLLRSFPSVPGTIGITWTVSVVTRGPFHHLLKTSPPKMFNLSFSSEVSPSAKSNVHQAKRWD